MKVKDLIEELSMYSPDSDLEFWVWDEETKDYKEYATCTTCGLIGNGVDLVSIDLD